MRRTVLLGYIPLNQPLVLLLTDPSNEACAGKLLPQPVRRQPVFREAEVEERGHIDVAANLFLLLDQVGAADVADGDLVTELREQLEHLGLDELARGD